MYERLIALRHIGAKRRKGFISFITLIAVGGVGVGVGALIIVMAVMNGFEKDLRQKILGVNPHLLLLPMEEGMIEGYSGLAKRMERLREIVAYAPFIHTQAILIAGQRVIGVTVKGIDPGLERGVTMIQSNLIAGSSSLDGEEELLVGSELASSLGVDVGTWVTLLFPTFITNPAMMRFRIGGIFRCGMYDYDSSVVYSNLKALQEIFGWEEGVSGVAIRLQDLYQASEVKERIIRVFGNRFWVRTWMELNRNLFLALRLEKVVMFIILGLIIFVAGLGIANTLILIVMHKKREIGILLSLGATRLGIGRIFMIEGLCIGMSGVILGLLIGLGGCWILSRYQVIRIPKDIYYIDHLPVDVRWTDVGIVVLSAILISLLAAIYPALRASRLEPLEVMRYE